MIRFLSCIFKCLLTLKEKKKQANIKTLILDLQKPSHPYEIEFTSLLKMIHETVLSGSLSNSFNSQSWFREKLMTSLKGVPYSFPKKLHHYVIAILNE